MPQITIIGGLPGDTDNKLLINELKSRSNHEIDWEWIDAEASKAYRPEQGSLSRLFHRIQEARSKPGNSLDKIRVITLFHLNNQTSNQIRKNYGDPILAPKSLQDSHEFLEWVFSPEANIFPRKEWYGNLKQAAFVAIASKLIKNKSWNKDTQGHQWTKENDLLNQAPVLRRNHQQVAVVAKEMLDQLEGTLLIQKGGTKGTPREWSLQSQFLGQIKEMIVQQSFNPIQKIGSIRSFLEQLEKDDQLDLRLDGEIVNEHVREICRNKH